MIDNPKQLQFELWTECDSKCTFCYLGDANCRTPEDHKLRNLLKIENIISDTTLYEEYDTIGFMGGEFFQGQLRDAAVKEQFFKLIYKLKDLFDEGYLKSFWIYVTLTRGDQKELYEALDILKDHTDKMWILTSYDTLGRFHTSKMEESWSNNMLRMQELYPGLKFNITSILTGDFIQKYLSDEFSFKRFMKKYKCAFFLKQCGFPSLYNSNAEMNAKIGYFFPTRDDFIKFLTKFRRNEDEVMWDKLFSIIYRADKVFRVVDEEGTFNPIIRHKDTYLEEGEDANGYIMDCGHMSKYSAYCDVEGCVLCDKQLIENLIL